MPYKINVFDVSLFNYFFLGGVRVGWGGGVGGGGNHAKLASCFARLAEFRFRIQSKHQ